MCFVMNTPPTIFYPPMAIQRYLFVRDFVEKHDPAKSLGSPPIRSVVDFGSNNCRLVIYLKYFPFVKLIRCVDLDTCFFANNRAEPTMYDYMKREGHLKIELYQGSVTEKDARFRNTDLVTCIELIEHMEKDQLEPLTENIFGFIKPKVSIISTPNFEYNNLIRQAAGECEESAPRFRDSDHKFEFTRAEFEAWCTEVILKYRDYTYSIDGVGQLKTDIDQQTGYSTQIAIFRKISDSPDNIKIDQSGDGEQIIGQPYKLHCFYECGKD